MQGVIEYDGSQVSVMGCLHLFAIVVSESGFSTTRQWVALQLQPPRSLQQYLFHYLYHLWWPSQKHQMVTKGFLQLYWLQKKCVDSHLLSTTVLFTETNENMYSQKKNMSSSILRFFCFRTLLRKIWSSPGIGIRYIQQWMNNSTWHITLCHYLFNKNRAERQEQWLKAKYTIFCIHRNKDVLDWLMINKCDLLLKSR